MPKCIVRSCPHKSGKKNQYPNVILHVFPKSLERIKLWLQQTGQEFEDLNGYAQRILEEKKNDNYRMCSVHFGPECYTYRGNNKSLRENAIPTIFPDVKGRPMIEESVFYRSHAKKLKRPACQGQSDLQVPASTSHITVVPTLLMHHSNADSNNLSSIRKDASTQTDLTCFTADQGMQFQEVTPGLSENLSNYSLITPKKEEVDETSDTTFENTARFAVDKNVVRLASLSSLAKDEPKPLDVTLESAKANEVVHERKFLVFESCLDTLFYKLLCGAGLGCKSRVAGFSKHIDGSFLSVTGYCQDGHRFKLWQSQPCLERGAVGNLLLSAAIYFSGANIKKVHEMNNLLGMRQISEADYYTYQWQFLFSVIDHNWLSEHQRTKEEIGGKPLSIAGDQLWENTENSSKYCIYTMIDLLSDKVVDFEVAPVTQCNSNVEEVFQNCLNRMLDAELDVHMVATDRHAGVKKLMKEKYGSINHQFNVWNYAGDLHKQLVAASKQKGCRNLGLWIQPIINHFWWSVRTCNGDENVLKETWHSILYHITDQHNWSGFKMYHSCSHKPLMPQERETTSWLKKTSSAYEHIRDIVKNPQLTKDLPCLTSCCHTGSIASFRSLMRKYRTDFNFGRDSLEARIKLAVLSHNHNICCKEVGQSMSIHPWEQERWIVNTAQGEKSNAHLRTLLTDLVKLCTGTLKPRWQPKSILPEVPCASSRLQQDFTVGEDVYSIVA